MRQVLTVRFPGDFREGVHYRLLTAGERKGSKWKAEMLRDVLFLYPTPAKYDYSVRQHGIEWGRITPRGVILRQRYRWNLCSASPDIEKCASAPHNLLYQFSGCLWFPSWLTRHWADDLFGHFCATSLGWLYRVGLLLGSWAFWKRPVTRGESVEIISNVEAT
jgi:hypothetical protein